jgi:hypothetical protein
VRNEVGEAQVLGDRQLRSLSPVTSTKPFRPVVVRRITLEPLGEVRADAVSR